MTELGLQHGTPEAWAGKWWDAGYSSILIRLFIHFGFVDTNRTSGEQIYRNIQYPPGTHKQRRCVSHSLFSPLLGCNYSFAGCFTSTQGTDRVTLSVMIDTGQPMIGDEPRGCPWTSTWSWAFLCQHYLGTLCESWPNSP